MRRSSAEATGGQRVDGIDFIGDKKGQLSFRRNWCSSSISEIIGSKGDFMSSFIIISKYLVRNGWFFSFILCRCGMGGKEFDLTPIMREARIRAYNSQAYNFLPSLAHGYTRGNCWHRMVLPFLALVEVSLCRVKLPCCVRFVFNMQPYIQV